MTLERVASRSRDDVRPAQEAAELHGPRSFGISRTLLVSVAALLVAGSAAQRPASAGRRPHPKVWSWSTRALGQLVAGDLSGAVTSLGRARAVQPLPEIDALVGLVALAGGDQAAARRQLDRAIAHGTTDPLVFYWAARAALVAGRQLEAARRLEQALAIGVDRPALHMAQALILPAGGAAGESGRSAAVARSLREVAATQPNLLDPALYPTPVAGAIELLHRLAEGFPHRVQLLRTLGHLHWRAGHTLSAMDCFRQVVARRSADGDALQVLARGYHLLGLSAEATATVDRAVAAAPDLPAVYAARGMILAARDPARAVADLQRAADATPRDATLLTLLARTCAAAGDKACAERFFGHAIRRDGRLAAAHYGLALLQQQGAQHQAAEQSFARAIRLDPAVPRYHEAAAHQHQIRGQRRQARQLLAAAARARPAFNRFERRREQVLKVARQLVTALEQCGCPLALGHSKTRPACSEPRAVGCGEAVGRLPPLPRRWFRAHLTGRGLPSLKLNDRTALRRLLLADPALLEQRAIAGQLLRARLPIVLPWLIR